jgi:hydrogenase maturation factor
VNLVFGQIVSIFVEDGMRLGKVRVGGAIKNASLELLTDAECGAQVLLCDGVAISRVQPETESSYVSRNSR